MFEVNKCSIINSDNVSLSMNVSNMTILGCKDIDIDSNISNSVTIQGIKFYSYPNVLPTSNAINSGFIFYDENTEELKLVTSTGIKTFQAI